jgi:hypothetical protein
MPSKKKFSFLLISTQPFATDFLIYQILCDVQVLDGLLLPKFADEV